MKSSYELKLEKLKAIRSQDENKLAEIIMEDMNRMKPTDFRKYYGLDEVKKNG